MSTSSKKEAARVRIAEKRAAEAAARAAEQRRRRTVVGGVVAAVVVVVAVVVAIVVQTQRTSTAADAASPGNLSSGGNGYTFSVGTGPVTVDVYEDFQCPNCRDFEDAAGSTLEQLQQSGTVTIVYHGMAFLDSSRNDDYSTRALNAAAVVASDAGTAAYQQFHDLLYANQPDEATGSGLTDDQLITYAQQAGATGEDVATDIRDLVYGDWVKNAEDQASKDGVNATPTVFVDGQELQPSQLNAEGVAAAVQDAAG